MAKVIKAVNVIVYMDNIIMMRKVGTRKDAFFEMRRYCEVNGIHGNETEVSINCDIYGQTCDEITMDGMKFVLFPSDNAHVSRLMDLSEYPNKCQVRDGATSLGNCTYYASHSNAGGEILFWYDELVAYFSDLEKRKAGGG